MTIYLNNDFHYETENLVRLFFPNDKITVVKELPDEKPLPLIYALILDEGSEKKIFVSVETEGRFLVDERSVSIHTQDLQKTLERTLAVLLYGLLVTLTGRKQPWGILTGVRPIKLFRRLAESQGEAFAKDYFRTQLLVSDEKTELSALTEKHEKKVLMLSRPRSFSLYVSIPFCPSRCSYCSFVSQTIENAKKTDRAIS